MPELPLVGQEFAGYRIRSVIGRGGMSVVYQADNLRLGSIVALKVLSAELSTNDLFRTRFLEESRIAASLNHPNVIPIYDMGPHEDLLYIVMRYVSGTDMRALLKKRDGPLAPADAVFLVSQAARALDAAHRKGLVHRDVKPGNFLVERGGDDDPDHVYLSDFGITKYALSRSGLTPTGEFLGTIDYVAPEQIQAVEVDGRADQYSLGCVLYECLTGRLPFQKDRDAAIIWAHVEEMPPMPSEVRPELPASIDAVMARVMAKKASDRYATCREFMEAANVALGSPVAGTGTVSRHEPEVMRSPTVSAMYSGTAEAPPVAEEPAPADRSATEIIRPAMPAAASAAREAGGGQAAPPPPPGPTPGGPASPPRSHRGRWIGAIAAALVLIIGAGIGIYVAGRDSGSSGHKGAAGMNMKGSSMPAKTKAGALDKALLLANQSGDAKGDLPPKTCHQKNVSLVTCTSPSLAVQQANFQTYPTLMALYNAYVAKVKSLSGGKFQANVNNCSLEGTEGETGWNHAFFHPKIYSLAQSESGKLMDSQAVGRVFCTFTGGLEYMVWTQNDGRMLGQAYGAPHEDVWNWWVGVHHNIALGGMKMSDMNMGT